MNHKTLPKFLNFVRRNNVPCLLWGPTGIGKTTAVYEWAELIGIKPENVHVLHLASQEPGDLVGLPTREGLNLDAQQQKELLEKFLEIGGEDASIESIIQKMSQTRTTWSRPEWLPPEDDEEEHIFFLDEFNRAPKYVQACMFPFILEGRMHTHKVPKNSYILGAANPGGTDDYDVTEMRDKAMISRLCHIKLIPTKEEWLIRHDDVVHEVVHKVIAKHPEHLGFDTCDIGFEVSADARAVTICGIALQNIENDEWHSFGYEFVEGCCGKTMASMIQQEWKDRLESISPEQVLDDYKKIRGDVKAYSNVANVRNDVIGGANTKLLVYIKKKGKLTEKQKKNLQDYLKDIPRDSAQSFLAQVAAGEEFCNEDVFRDLMLVLGKDNKLYIYILRANNPQEAEREEQKLAEKEEEEKKTKKKKSTKKKAKTAAKTNDNS